MKTKFVSDDGFEFDTKYQCQKYEEAKNNYSSITELKHAPIKGEEVYEVSSIEELVYYHVHVNNGEMGEDTFFKIFQAVKDSNHRFPIYIFSNSHKSDKKLQEILEEEIEKEKQKMDDIKRVIKEKRSKINDIKSVKEKINELHKGAVGAEQS